MDIQDIRQYHSPTESPDSDVTLETVLACVRKEQLTLGVSDSDSDSDSHSDTSLSTVKYRGSEKTTLIVLEKGRLFNS